PSLLAPSIIARAAALAGETVAGREYLAAGHFGLVYTLVPLVSLSATCLVLAPGLLVAMLFGRSRTFTEWLFLGFACSLVLVSVVSGAVQSAVGPALRGSLYATVLLAFAAGVFVVLLRRVERLSVVWPFASPDAVRDFVALLVLWGLSYMVLAPKLLWESFNGDGAHAFESSRLLLQYALPFWPEGAGPVGGFPGITTMLYAFPNAWFLRLFGELEFAARLPFLLYVPVLACGLRELAGVGLPGARLARPVFVAFLLGVCAYVLAMAFSATYSPYSADIALPATQDTLLMIVYVGALVASLRREWGWLALFVVLTYLSLPSGLILLGFWLVARALVERPVPWRDLAAMAGLLIAALVAAPLAPRLLAAWGAALPGGEYGIVGILRYFAFLQFTDAARLLYVAIPAGIFPIVACLMWRSMDRVSKALTLVTLAYFLFFFVQAHVSLHHFVPAMILPMAVALRQAMVPAGRRVAAAAWLPLGAAAVLLAWPWGRLAMHREGREIGQTVRVSIPGYAASSPDVMHASTLLDRLFPYDWDPTVPAVYGGSPLVWNHYARHEATPSPEANYLLQRASAPAPAGWRLAGTDSAGAALYVRSDSLLTADRRRQPASPPGSPLLAVPRGILFHGIPLDRGPRIFDVVATLESWGVDLDPLLARLGVRRGS
ncbi:MAG: hypothetical protein ACT4P7_21160, partial [Gemmatimonadaceae bacterium]